MSCLLVAGCSRGTAGSLPFHGFDSSVGREVSPNVAPDSLQCGASYGNGTNFQVTQSDVEPVLQSFAANDDPTFRSVYSFKNTPDGLDPTGRMSDVNGKLYGTTQAGGSYNYGTIFRVTQNGLETVLHSFTAGADGEEPVSGLTQSNGTLYGTTLLAGANQHCGTVFQLVPPARFSVIHPFDFGPGDGCNPRASPIEVNGTLYGTASSCGAAGYGAVYEITPSGSESLLYSFKGAPDGAGPWGRLLDINGTLYGTTQMGGTSDFGTVFAIAPDGTETVLHSFAGALDGYFPESALIDVHGTLYGTTLYGGASTNCGDQGCGTVFKVSLSGSESVVYNFAGNSDGQNPVGGLIYVKGNLYGTTAHGGAGGIGTVFKVTTSGTETVIFTFDRRSEGESPEGGLTREGGWLYGTTSYGGDYGAGYGTVFKLPL